MFQEFWKKEGFKETMKRGAGEKTPMESPKIHMAKTWGGPKSQKMGGKEEAAKRYTGLQGSPKAFSATPHTNTPPDGKKGRSEKGGRVERGGLKGKQTNTERVQDRKSQLGGKQTGVLPGISTWKRKVLDPLTLRVNRETEPLNGSGGRKGDARNGKKEKEYGPQKKRMEDFH